MTEFSGIILPCLAAAGSREIVEIGAEFGGMSQLLADYAAAAGGRLTSIDPAPKDSFVEWARSAAVRHVPELSLAAIPEQRGVDAWVVDGDHNWYTVYHETHAIAERAREDGKPLLVFYHDVGWPWARARPVLRAGPDSRPNTCTPIAGRAASCPAIRACCTIAGFAAAASSRRRAMRTGRAMAC
jgi:hypothetical protein